MGYVIAIFNRKGGVGKTTSCINIGAVYASQKKKVLLIDGDSQRNMTQFFFSDNEEIFSYNDEIKEIDIKDSVNTISDVLYGDVRWQDAVIPVGYKARVRDEKTHRFKVLNVKMDVIPGTRHLDFYAGDDVHALEKISQELKSSYDYILIDFPPSYNFLTEIYLLGSDYIIAPMHLAKDSSLSGYRDLVTKCRGIREMYDKDIPILGAFYTNVQIYKKDQKVIFDYSMTKEIKQQMGFFKTYVPNGYKSISNSEDLHKPLVCGEYSENITLGYRNLAKEIEKRILEERKNGR